jgi:bacterioferritin
MHRHDLIEVLNHIYTIEIQQVNTYLSQSRMMQDIYISKTLGRIAEMEQRHADVVGEKIRSLGGTPSVIGHVLGSLTGTLVGNIASRADLVNLFKLNITLEEKAMADYKALIIKMGEEDLFNLFWAHLIEEDLHTAWFANKMEQLRDHELLSL